MLDFFLISLAFITALLSKLESPSTQVSTFPKEQCQIYCVYNLNYQPDSTNPGFRANERMTLLIGKTSSKFESVGGFLADSLSAAMPDGPGSNFDAQLYADKLMALPTSRFLFKIYKDRSANQVYPFDKVGGKLYQYPEPVSKLNWKLLPDKMVVASYPCQKAVTSFAGRNYEAWFTSEIPVADGPYKFFGLPGLIIKISDTRNQYVFQLTSFSQIKRTIFIELPKGPTTLTTKPVLRKAQQNYISNLPNMMATRSALSSPEAKQSMRSQSKRLNNAIDLH